MAPKKIKDPDLGEYYRATCEEPGCGKVFESRNVNVVLNNLIEHRGRHNGHS